MPDPTNENVGSPAWREEMEGLIRKATEEMNARQAEVAVQVLGIAAQQPGPAGEVWREVMRALILKATEVLRRGRTGQHHRPAGGRCAGRWDTGGTLDGKKRQLSTTDDSEPVNASLCVACCCVS